MLQHLGKSRRIDTLRSISNHGWLSCRGLDIQGEGDPIGVRFGGAIATLSVIGPRTTGPIHERS